MVKLTENDELSLIRERYAKRKTGFEDRYNPLNPEAYMSRQEKERALISLLKKVAMPPLGDRSLLEIGCGSGLNLLHLIRLGFRPENLAANELLEDRLKEADLNLPSSVKRLPGDATMLQIPDGSYDIVYQSTVFSSILDGDFQYKLADTMWGWVKPGGGILWYDFIYNNPGNDDVQGVSADRIKSLFPEGTISKLPTTLAPPISRLVCRVHPSLYTIFNLIPILRTHILCFIKKN